MTEGLIKDARKIADLIRQRDELDAQITKTLKTLVPIGPGPEALRFARTVRGLSPKDRAKLTKLKAEQGIQAAIQAAEKLKSNDHHAN